MSHNKHVLMDRGAGATQTSPLLRLDDVAAHFGVGMRTVRGWRASGRLRVLVLGPRCLRVEPAELDRFKREARA